MQSRWIFLLPCMAIASGAAWAGYAPEPGPFQSIFGQGENFIYAIRWGALTGGYSNLSIQSVDQIAGAPAYHIVSEAHSTGIVDAFYHVDDRNEAWLDTGWPRS